MERLSDKDWYLTKCRECKDDDCNFCNALIKACEKLEEYEDLEEQGKLLKLPCAVGDTVYVLQADLESIGRSHCKAKITESKFDYWMIPIFGKLSFYTQEEAENALKEP